MSSLPNSGGTLTSPSRAPAAKVIAGALSNNRVASQLIASIAGYSHPYAIIAAHTSTTTDFGALLVGDLILHIPATAGNAQFGTVATAGTLPFAAVVGDLYVVMRVVNLDGNNPLIPPPPATLTGRTTGDGGLDF